MFYALYSTVAASCYARGYASGSASWVRWVSVDCGYLILVFLLSTLAHILLHLHHYWPIVSQPNKMGHGSIWWIPPKQKYSVRYGLSPNVQSLYELNLRNAVFNTFRRVRKQLFFVVVPVGAYWYLWDWAKGYNAWLYTKDGRKTLESLS